MLPTAEDVEAMIQSMSSEGTCMDDSGSQSHSCPPSVPTSTGKPGKVCHLVYHPFYIFASYL